MGQIRVINKKFINEKSEVILFSGNFRDFSEFPQKKQIPIPDSENKSLVLKMNPKLQSKSRKSPGFWDLLPTSELYEPITPYCRVLDGLYLKRGNKMGPASLTFCLKLKYRMTVRPK